MNEKSYPRIGETVLEKTLPNGLKIFIVPKPQHRKKYAFFATRYGGMDMQFIRNGEKCDTPAGHLPAVRSIQRQQHSHLGHGQTV